MLLTQTFLIVTESGMLISEYYFKLIYSKAIYAKQKSYLNII